MNDFDYRLWFWRLQALGWTAAGALPLVLAVPLQLHASDLVAFCGFRTLTGVLVTCGLRPLYRRMRQAPGSIAAKTLLVVTACVAVSAAETWLMLQVGAALDDGFTSRRIPGFTYPVTATRTMMFLIWSLLYFAIPAVIHQRQTEAHLLRSKIALQAAELEALRSQMVPHFLFNALNSVKAEAEAGNSRAVSRISQSFANYTRQFLLQGDHWQTLGEELDALGNYLEVAKFCYEERLEYSLSASDTTRAARVPVLLLQPLVENALKHGLDVGPGPVRIRVEVTEGNPLRVDVTNTGRWIERDAGHRGIGLTNLRRRLSLLLGPEATLTTHPGDGHVRVTLSLPRSQPA